jgi:hypothetical protein
MKVISNNLMFIPNENIGVVITTDKIININNNFDRNSLDRCLSR